MPEPGGKSPLLLLSSASFEFAQKLVQARDVEEVVRLQTDYLKAQIQALNEQTKELADAAARVAKETTSTIKPL